MPKKIRRLFDYRFAPQEGHFVDPVGTFAPQLEHRIEPIDELPIVELIIDGFVIPGLGVVIGIATDGPLPKKALT